ncbi:MAG: NosD domain-containing protein, partial [Candidatus Thorarchaeota archaeon]
MEINAKAIIILILIVVFLPLNSRNQMDFCQNIAVHDSTEVHEIGTHPQAVTTSMESSPLETNIVFNPTSKESNASTKRMVFSSNYTIRGPINITSNEEFAIQKAAEGWEGNGTEGNPYIIQGYNITFNGHNIHIENVTSHFEIRDCLLISSSSMPRVGEYDDGIGIINSTNAAIINNVILGGDDSGVFVGWSKCIVRGNHFYQYNGTFSYRGIIFNNSSGSVINNELSNYEMHGIWVVNSSYVEMTSNSLSRGEVGIYLLDSNHIILSSNTLTGYRGIWAATIESCSIMENEILNCSDTGIQFAFSNNVIIKSNSFNDCGSSIFLVYLNQIDISNNTVIGGRGIYLSAIENCEVTNNEILNCFRDGTEITSGRNVSIISNSISNCGRSISLLYSEYIEVTQNTVIGGGRGLYFRSLENSNITNNDILYCEDSGIESSYSINVRVKSNSITDCGRTIYLRYSDHIEVSDNLLTRGRGIGLYASDECSVTNNVILFALEAGIEDEESKELMIIQNVIRFAGSYGILTTVSSFSSYIANEISSAPTGIHILSTYHSIFSFNHLIYNHLYGITILYGYGNSLYGNLLGPL